MDSNPPIHAAVNPPTAPHTKDTTITKEYLNAYKKDNNNTYWFQRIPEDSWKQKKNAWKNLIQRSIIDYGSALEQLKLFSKDIIDEFEAYIIATNQYIEN